MGRAADASALPTKSFFLAGEDQPEPEGNPGGPGRVAQGENDVGANRQGLMVVVVQVDEGLPAGGGGQGAAETPGDSLGQTEGLTEGADLRAEELAGLVKVVARLGC